MAGEAVTETKSLHLPSGFNQLPDGWQWSRLDDVCLEYLIVHIRHQSLSKLAHLLCEPKT